MLIGAVNMGMQSARLLALGARWLVVLLGGAIALEHAGVDTGVLAIAFGSVFGGERRGPPSARVGEPLGRRRPGDVPPARAAHRGGPPAAVLLVVTDPPDPLADLARELSGHERILGTGTLLDSLRFRVHLPAAAGVSPAEVEAQVLGEHGTTEVFAWSARGLRH